MGYLNLDIKEGSFDEIGASGTLDGMCENYKPSWELNDLGPELDEQWEQMKKLEWDYEE